MEQSTTPAMARGQLLDGRYRLDQVRDERQLPNGRRIVLWRAVDTALDRRVALLVASGRTKKSRKLVADAATRASRVTDGRFVRVLDVGDVDVGPDPATWVATEWVEAPPLAAVLRRAPLPPPVATELVRQLGQALAAAAAAGAHHGRLHPDEVLLPDDGVPRLTGLEVSAALADAEPTGAEDVRGLGALLFAALTGSWPLPGWQGLPPPARDDGHPRSTRRDVPREVDEVAARALAGGFGDITTLVKALGRLPTRALDAPPPQRTSRAAPVARRWAWRVVPPLLVATIAGGAWTVGSDLGRVPGTARARHAALPPTSTTAPGAGRLTLVWSSPPTVTSFDPEGDGQENQGATGFAVDHDASTTWTTDLYQHNSHFGGLKSGVGLLLDLGRPTSVAQADLALSTAGSDVELRAGNAVPQRASDLRLVTTTTRAPAQVSWKLPAPVSARYWLIWFTDLPKVNGGYRIGVTDIALLGTGAG